MVGEPYGGVLSLVLGMKNIQRGSSILRNKDFNRSVEKLAGRLNFRIVSVDAIFSLPPNVLLKRLIGDELGKVFLITRLSRKKKTWNESMNHLFET